MAKGFDPDFTKALKIEMRKGTSASSGIPSTRPLKSEAELLANITLEQCETVAGSFQLADVQDRDRHEDQGQ